MTQICVFNMHLFSLHNTLNYAIHGACLRMVLLTDVYRNQTSLWIKPRERAFKQFKRPVLNVLMRCEASLQAEGYLEHIVWSVVRTTNVTLSVMRNTPSLLFVEGRNCSHFLSCWTVFVGGGDYQWAYTESHNKNPAFCRWDFSLQAPSCLLVSCMVYSYYVTCSSFTLLLF